MTQSRSSAAYQLDRALDQRQGIFGRVARVVPDLRGGSPPAPAEAGGSLIDAGLTIKGAELTRAGLGVLGQGRWGWVEAGVRPPMGAIHPRSDPP